MPCLDLDFLNKLKEDYTKYKNFVETGTYLGETILSMEKYFPNLHTIEIKREFIDDVKNKYNGNKISFHLGDSTKMLYEVLSTLSNSSIIFLDGHWSAGNTGRGVKDCPLYEELISIMSTHVSEAIIIVDDVRLFGIGPNNSNEICNWENISIDNILKIVQNRMTDHYFLPSELYEKDRLIIHISSA